MVVAIDFRHWAEESSAAARQENHEGSSHGDAPTVVDFYTPAPSSAADNGSSATPAATARATANGAALHVEAMNPTDDSDNVNGIGHGSTSIVSAVPLLRGSAAMVQLLKEAVEVHQVPWYDPAYLASFAGDHAAASKALAVCFRGCRCDGITPMLMPATAERVELLLSVSTALQAAQTSFFKLLADSEGWLYRDDGTRFIQRLVALHPRYQDWVPHPLRPSEAFPILKLSQLTALALQRALPALWAAQQEPLPAGEREVCLHGGIEWLRARYRQQHAASSSSIPRQSPADLFEDAAELSICCDYQIPRALREAGMLVYDDDLAALVDTGTALPAGGSEEASLRVATLVAAEALLAYLRPVSSREVAVPELDFALWHVGRHPMHGVAASRHHLCRTIMY